MLERPVLLPKLLDWVSKCTQVYAPIWYRVFYEQQGTKIVILLSTLHYFCLFNLFINPHDSSSPTAHSWRIWCVGVPGHWQMTGRGPETANLSSLLHFFFTLFTSFLLVQLLTSLISSLLWVFLISLNQQESYPKLSRLLLLSLLSANLPDQSSVCSLFPSLNQNRDPSSLSCDSFVCERPK